MLSIVEYLTFGPDTGISEQVQRIDRLEVKGVLQEYIPAMTLRTYFDHQLANLRVDGGVGRVRRRGGSRQRHQQLRDTERGRSVG